MRANAAPMTANWTRFSVSHSTLAPRSRTTESFFSVGSSAASAGRSIPGIVRSVSLAIAISAPVLPALTIACASPALTAAIPMPIDVVRARRTAADGLSGAPG